MLIDWALYSAMAFVLLLAVAIFAGIFILLIPYVNGIAAMAFLVVGLAIFSGGIFAWIESDMR